jgi:hypothetical protein
MYATEVEEGHIEIHGGFEMVNCFAESETQARKAAKMCPHAQVGAFDVRRADAGFVRFAAHNDWNGCRDFRRLIPIWPFTVTASVQLDQLSEINVRSKIFFDGGNVTAEAIRRKLESARDALAQVSDEVISGHRFTLGNEVGQNHFCFGVNRHPDVLVSPLHRRAGKQVAFFGVNEGPEFIGLDKARMNAAHASVKQISAFVANREKQRKNRSLVSASNPRHGANAHTFHQERYDLRGPFRAGVVTAQRPLARLRKRGFAGRAAIPLDSLTSVGSESLCSIVLASQAGHVASPLVFLREKPENEGLGFRLGLSPRLDSASPLVQASGEAFLFRILQLPESFGHACAALLPTIGGNTFYCIHIDFLFVFHPNQCGRDGRERIGQVAAEVKTIFEQPVSNLCDCEPFSACVLHCLSDSVTQAHLFAKLRCESFSPLLDYSVPFVIGEHVHGGVHELRQLRTLGVEVSPHTPNFHHPSKEAIQ